MTPARRIAFLPILVAYLMPAPARSAEIVLGHPGSPYGDAILAVTRSILADRFGTPEAARLFDHIRLTAELVGTWTYATVTEKRDLDQYAAQWINDNAAIVGGENDILNLQAGSSRRAIGPDVGDDDAPPGTAGSDCHTVCTSLPLSRTFIPLKDTPIPVPSGCR